ncbi:MAG TPA: hypothetical protein O0X42_02695, partial [Methanocorpusculum sp.]|nr:hypothetical protein [Methanocorpusculum sp.]
MNQQSKFRKAVLILLAVFLVASCLFTASAAAKEEVVYANLDKSGDVEGVYIVNIFGYKELIDAVAANPEEPVIVDYGDYSSVKNLVTTEPIIKTGTDEYTIYLNPVVPADGKLYYQGNMRDAVIPWSIDVSFFLNGEEKTADEIAGAAGHVTVVINIAANPAYGPDNSFYKNYALTVTILLDANKCLNIVSKDATMANNAANKQLTYTILPDRDTKIVIDTDTVDFGMGEININGVRLSLHINTDSIDMSDIDDLKDGVRKLTDTAYTLSSLAAAHYTKTNQLQSGGLNSSIRAEAQKMASVTNELYNGLAKLKNETKDMDTKITDKVN